MAKHRPTSALGLRITRRINDLNAEAGSKQYSKLGLADYCEVTPQAVTKWMQEGTISREKTIRAAEYLKMTVDALLGRPGIDEEAHELALDWMLLREPMRSRWKHTIKAAADAIREESPPEERPAKEGAKKAAKAKGRV